MRALIVALAVLAACADRDQSIVGVTAIVEPAITDIVDVRITVTSAQGATRAELGAPRGPGVIVLPNDELATVRGEAVDATGTTLASSTSAPTMVSDGSLVALKLASPAQAMKNHAPVIDALVASATTVVPGGTLTLSATAHDPDGDPLAIAWSGPGTFANPSALATSWTAPAATGAVTLQLAVTDPSGAHDAMTIRITVQTVVGSAKITAQLESAPQVTGMTLDAGRLQLGVASTARAVASDPDGDRLTYAWQDSCGVVITGTGKSVQVRVPTGSPDTSCTLHVVVDDGKGLTNSGDLVLAVGAGAIPDAGPVVDQTFQSIDRVAGGGSVVLRVFAHDPEGSAVTFSWTAPSGTLAGESDTAASSEVTWRAPAGCFGGEANIEAVLRDTAGAMNTVTFAVIGLDTGC